MKKIRKSLNTIIQQFTNTHGNTYDYSCVNYLGSNHRVEIICKIHGSYFQWPNDHISGSGCSYCSGNSKISQDGFVQRSKKVHGDTYILDNAVYKTSKTKVQIGCKIHGNFFVAPSDFWKGVGCRHCGFDRAKSIKITKGIINDPAIIDEFILYKRKVRSISDKSYKEYAHIINPKNIPRSKTWHLDHKFSIYEGFQSNVPPEVIGHWSNLTMLDNSTNQSKGTRCSLTLDQLVKLD
jgi:hypothetical protein